LIDEVDVFVFTDKDAIVRSSELMLPNIKHHLMAFSFQEFLALYFEKYPLEQEDEYKGANEMKN